MWELELDWTRCPDGVEIIEKEPPDDRKLTIVEEAAYGRYVAAMTARRVEIKLELHDLENPVCVALANADTDEKLLAFFARYGLLDRDGQPVPQETAAAWRQDILSLLARATLGAPTDTRAINHALGRNKAVVVPKLAEGPRLTLVASDLIAFMLMEIAAVAEAGAQMMACDHCGTLFLTGSRTGRRSTARFCRDLCRTRALRAKMRAKT